MRVPVLFGFRACVWVSVPVHVHARGPAHVDVGVWQGTYAIPDPWLTMVAVRGSAQYDFLGHLTVDVAGNILSHGVKEVRAWFNFLDTIGVRCLAEVDNKDQFRKMDPAEVV